MGVQIPVGFGEVTYLFACSGITKRLSWSMGYEATVSGAAAAATYFYGEATEAGRPYVATNISNQYSFLGVQTREMTVSGPILGQVLTTITGTAVFAPVPANSSYLFHKNTASGGRKNRGRFFVPPMHGAEASIDAAGRLTSGDVAGLQSVYAAMVTEILASSRPYVLLHSGLESPTPITSVTLQSQLATQRRRMR